jgi:hypothetical protein
MKIDRSMKRFFIRFYQSLVLNNGEAYAAARFVKLREVMMAYRADPDRVKKLEVYLRATTWRRTGWLRKLFRYLDSAPEQALNFVKLYCGLSEPTVTVGQAGEAQHVELSIAEKNVNEQTPHFLTKWLACCTSKFWWNQRLYRSWHDKPETIPEDCSWARSFIVSHTWQEFISYHSKWYRLLKTPCISEDACQQAISQNLPKPEMYVDANGVGDHIQSDSLEKDFWNFFLMSPDMDGDGGISPSSWNYVASFLDDNLRWSLSSDEDMLAFKPKDSSFLDGCYVGHIHHIPKKGTVKRRSIAAPNRFLQAGMAPCDRQLSVLLKALGRSGRDCTYNQNRLDRYIGNRVTNPSLYAGSVDLHQATDYLPLEWMKTIWSFVYQDRVTETVQKSWKLFLEVSRGPWENCGYLDHWTKGQPLGALPSFRCLGITHNLLLESLSFCLGYSHSPYTVLGDDVVIMSKKLRKEYIKLMDNVGVPLSLNKSYEGNLVQFAGKTFIANMAPFYTTDQGPVTWNNLFDYQWATGVKVPFNRLPSQIRKRIEKVCSAMELSRGKAEEVYDCAFWYYYTPRGASGFPLSTLDLPWEDMALAMSHQDEGSKDPTNWSGIANFSGHPVSYLNYDFAEKDGHFLRYRRTSNWYRDKFRPCSTDTIIHAAATALLSATGK